MRPVLISLSPDSQKDDLCLAVKLLLSPSKWQQGESLKGLKELFMDYFGAQAAFGLKTGRSALWLALKALNLKKGDEVLLQAFTCVVVPNAIRYAGAKPVFVDTERDCFNISIKDLRAKVTTKTRAIVVQHIFGFSDNLEAIKKICQEKKIVLVEDCAQSLGAVYQGNKIGSFGDMAMFSFGRDKMISSVNGGLLIVNQPKLASRAKDLYKGLTFPDRMFIFKNLLHPMIFSLANPLYFSLRLGKLSLGKAILFIFQRLHLIERPVQLIELEGGQPDSYAQKLPNAMAGLVEHQFNKLNWNLEQRRQLARFYLKELAGLPVTLVKPSQVSGPTYLRFPILVRHPEKLIGLARQEKILLGDWYRCPIAPCGARAEAVGYQPGSCPQAERLAAQVVNLPTYPKMTLFQAEKVVRIVKQYCQRYED